MQPLISVIIPVYNVEKHIARCLDSVLKQTYKNLEIILIDDGSPDNCPLICDEYAKKDNRIKVIHKENGGVSSARNKGLDVSTGEYIIFIDSDDYIELSMLEDMLKNALDNNTDGVFCGYKMLYEEKDDTFDVSPKQFGIVNNIEALLQVHNITENIGYDCLACNKLVKRDAIGNIRFELGLTTSEDALFFTKVVLNCKRIYLNPTPYYHYYKRVLSASNTKGLTKQKIDNVIAWKLISKEVRSYKILKNNAESRVFLYGGKIISLAYVKDNKELVKKMQREMSKCWVSFLKGEWRAKTKVVILLKYVLIYFRFPKKIISKMSK